ncbi:MAG: PilW family protein, partial [Dokdonella sp.]
MQTDLAHGTRFRPARQVGVSLIELMVGILISSILLLGMYQIFSASRVTFQMQDGLSRVQENGRFAMDYLQRNVRMAGFMGCGSDIGRANQATFVNHLANANGTMPAATGAEYRFQRPIEGYTVGTMTPTSDFAAVTTSANPPVDASDVLILRILSEESVPIITIDKTAGNLQVVVRPSNTTSPIFTAAGSNAIYAMQNCRSADVFQAKLNATNMIIDGLTVPNVFKDLTVTDCSNGNGGCPWDFRVSNAFLNAKPLVGASVLNGEIHRAEYLGIYVRNNAGGIPSLYVRRFERGGSAGGLAPVGTPEELAEGVERMLIRYGVDTDGDNVIDAYRTA